MQRGSRGSLNNILTNMKNMQRRQSSGRNYNHLRLSGGAGPVTLHPDDVGYERGEEDDEDDEDEDDDLLFEMSDMTAIK